MLPVAPIPAEVGVRLPPTIQAALLALYEGKTRRDAAGLGGCTPAQLAGILAAHPKLQESIAAHNSAMRLVAETAALGRITRHLTENDKLSARDAADAYRTVRPKEESGGALTFVFPTTFVQKDSE